MLSTIVRRFENPYPPKKWWGNPEYDVIANDDWRMPTDAEWEELVRECDWTWGQYKGSNGYYVSSRKTNGKMFLPVQVSPDDSSFDFVLFMSASTEARDWYLRMQNGDYDNNPSWHFFAVAEDVHELTRVLPMSGNTWTNPNTGKPYTFTYQGWPEVTCYRAVHK